MAFYGPAPVYCGLWRPNDHTENYSFFIIATRFAPPPPHHPAPPPTTPTPLDSLSQIIEPGTFCLCMETANLTLYGLYLAIVSKNSIYCQRHGWSPIIDVTCLSSYLPHAFCECSLSTHIIVIQMSLYQGQARFIRVQIVLCGWSFSVNCI